MSQDVIHAKFALLGFGDNLREAIAIIQELIEDYKPLADGATLAEAIEFAQALLSKIERLRALYSKIMGSPSDEATVNVQLESLLSDGEGYQGRPVIEVIRFIAANWKTILSIIAIL